MVRQMSSITLLICVVTATLAWANDKEGASAGTSGKSTSATPWPYPSNHPIKIVKGESFRELVVDPTLPVVLAFAGFKKSKSAAAFGTLFEEVATSLTDYALFRVMDSDGEEGKGLAQMFGVQQFPAILLFNPELLPVQGGQEGQYMKAPVGYQGPLSAAGVTAFVLMGMASHQLERLADLQDLEDFLAKYTMQDVGKVLLFFNDTVVPPMFKACSHFHRYGALFGVVNVSTPEAQEIADRYNVKHIPSVVIVTGPEDSDILADEPAGSITVKKLCDFTGKVALDKERKQQLQSFFMEAEIAARKKAQEEAKMNRALPVLTISTEQEWKEQCLERTKGYCVACLVEDPAGVDVEMLTDAAKKMAQRSTSTAQIVVIDGPTNFDIAEYFGATNGFPEVIFINPSKKGYHNLVGAFNARSIVNFFADKATVGRGKKYELGKVPKFKRSAAPAGSAEQEEDDVISDEM